MKYLRNIMIFLRININHNDIFKDYIDIVKGSNDIYKGSNDIFKDYNDMFKNYNNIFKNYNNIFKDYNDMFKDYNDMTETEVHAELVYAECLLLKVKFNKHGFYFYCKNCLLWQCLKMYNF